MNLKRKKEKEKNKIEIQIRRVETNYQKLLEKEVILAAFIPLVVYVANAVGIQTQTLYIRDLAVSHNIAFINYSIKQSDIELTEDGLLDPQLYQFHESTTIEINWEALKQEMVKMLTLPQGGVKIETGPRVTLVIGVNGSGKTTSIAKLAYKGKSEGQTVLLAAGDTFRAAAIDQIKAWAERIGVGVIAHQPGSDPGAVVYDAMNAAVNRHANQLIIDTCLLYTSPSPRDRTRSRMPSSA